MIRELDDSVSIFDTGADVMVNLVNCLGTSGKGLAAEFARRYPENQMRLIDKKNTLGKLVPGNIYWFKPASFPLFANMTTKDHWRGKSRIEWIKDGLQTLRDTIDNGITSVAIPRAGCGLGGLDWEKEVKPLVLSIFGDAPYEVLIWP